jgi:hypothetical protein
VRVETANFFAGVQRIADRHRVVTFFPAIGGHVATAFSVGARIHHHDAVAVAEKEFRVAQIASAIVGYAVKKQHPIAIC